MGGFSNFIFYFLLVLPFALERVKRFIDGSKLVEMGGRYTVDGFVKYLSDLYILDLDTLVWTPAESYSSPRIY